MDGINRMLVRQRQADLKRAAERHGRVLASRAARREYGIFGLPRELWIVVVGIFFNYVGYGAVLPFEIIYLHDGRGFGLGVAGLVVGLLTGVAILSAPFAGPLIDRFGARAVAAAAGFALAVGYAGLAFANSPARALIAAAIAGAGNGALNPSQSTLVATLTSADMRHRATAVSRVAANIGAGIGAGLGGLVATYGLAGFIALFLTNGVTYILFAGILLISVRDDARPEPITGGYRVVFRDATFVRLALTNVAIIAVGWGVFTWLVPPYAEGNLGIGARRIGLLLLANAVTVAALQVVIARFAEGRRRMGMMAHAAWIFVFACGLVVFAGTSPAVAYPALLAASILVGVGECLHTTVLVPLVADLAPPSVRGRYMATVGLSWWTGLAIAPVFGASLLSVSPIATFLVAAGMALGAGFSALTLERRIPEAVRLTPRPQVAVVAESGSA